MSKYQRESYITNIVFCELKIEGQILKNQNMFLFGGKSGVVCLADDKKHCSEICKVGGSVRSLLFY